MFNKNLKISFPVKLISDIKFSFQSPVYPHNTRPGLNPPPLQPPTCLPPEPRESCGRGVYEVKEPGLEEGGRGSGAENFEVIKWEMGGIFIETNYLSKAGNI